MQLEDADLLPYLRAIGLLADCGARIETPTPGAGSYLRRVISERGERWIVKQTRARPGADPPEPDTTARAQCEHRFLSLCPELTRRSEGTLPRVLHFDAARRALVLEDLGPGPDLREALAAGEDLSRPLERLGGFLGAVHSTSRSRARPLRDRFQNFEARRQLAERLFEEPAPGGRLSSLPGARRTLASTDLRRALALLASHYARESSALVHGNVGAPNLLLRDGELRLIDAEHAHIGDPALDLGGALAPLQLERAARSTELSLLRADRALVRGYLGAGGRRQDLTRARAYAGALMLRDLLDASRAGPPRPPDTTRAMLERSARLVLSALQPPSERSERAPAH